MRTTTETERSGNPQLINSIQCLYSNTKRLVPIELSYKITCLGRLFLTRTITVDRKYRGV